MPAIGCCCGRLIAYDGGQLLVSLPLVTAVSFGCGRLSAAMAVSSKSLLRAA